MWTTEFLSLKNRRNPRLYCIRNLRIYGIACCCGSCCRQRINASKSQGWRSSCYWSYWRTLFRGIAFGRRILRRSFCDSNWRIKLCIEPFFWLGSSVCYSGLAPSSWIRWMSFAVIPCTVFNSSSEAMNTRFQLLNFWSRRFVFTSPIPGIFFVVSTAFACFLR